MVRDKSCTKDKSLKREIMRSKSLGQLHPLTTWMIHVYADEKEETYNKSVASPYCDGDPALDDDPHRKGGGSDIRFELQQKHGLVASMTLYNEEILETVEVIAAQTNVCFEVVMTNKGNKESDNGGDERPQQFGVEEIASYLQAVLAGEFSFSKKEAIGSAAASVSNTDESTGEAGDEGAVVSSTGKRKYFGAAVRQWWKNVIPKPWPRGFIATTASDAPSSLRATSYSFDIGMLRSPE